MLWMLWVLEAIRDFWAFELWQFFSKCCVSVLPILWYRSWRCWFQVICVLCGNNTVLISSKINFLTSSKIKLWHGCMLQVVGINECSRFSSRSLWAKFLCFRYWLYTNQGKVIDFPTVSNSTGPTFCMFATGFLFYCTSFFNEAVAFWAKWAFGSYGMWLHTNFFYMTG